MALTDLRGDPVSTANRASLDGYEKALAEFNCYVGDPLATINGVLEADPSFVMGHALRAHLLLLSTEKAAEPELRKSVEAAEALSNHANERERGHVRAARAWLDGDYQGTPDLLEKVLTDHPRDLLALQVAHLTDFFVGDSQSLRDRVARVLPAWDAKMPAFGIVHGFHAFGLEEMGDYKGAEKEAKLAIERNPKDVWAIHAFAHVCEMQARHKEGMAWYEGREADWGANNFFKVHNWWHLALYYLDRGDSAKALAFYDGPIRAERSRVPVDLVDAAAMLWRFHLLGVDCGRRWDELADLYAAQAEDCYYAFNDAHGMMCFVGAGRDADAERLLRAQERYIQTSAGTNAMMTRDVGLPVCRALRAYGAGDYGTVIDLLMPVRNKAHRFGGSHAQRDLLTLTMIMAALKGGRFGAARALANERIALKPKSASGHAFLAEAFAGLGEARAAKAAARKAAALRGPLH
ncbi:MAG: tetratricopeptide repeat protein [Alphaproteobacteria bacterium]